MTAKKVQISVSIDEPLLDWIDKQIEEEARFATRSHAIVYALTYLMKEDKKKKEVKSNL